MRQNNAGLRGLRLSAGIVYSAYSAKIRNSSWMLHDRRQPGVLFGVDRRS
jgi:hypothetical protein